MAESHPDSLDFTSFYRRTLTPLRRYLARLTGSKSDAQDIAHDAYARVFPAMEQRDIAHPQALLYTTARHLAIDRFKRQGRSPITPVDEAEGTSPSPAIESLVMAREEWGLVQTALANLPPGCRRVLILRTVDQLSHAEIAARLAISTSSVEKHLMRAMRLLHTELNRTSGRATEVHPFNSRTGSAVR